MAYYRTCPLCGSNNDPGEACDCRETKKEAAPLHRERPQANAYPLPVYQPFCPKVLYEQYAGELTDEKVAEILDDFQTLRNRYETTHSDLFKIGRAHV